jgi:hypothetical protein
LHSVCKTPFFCFIILAGETFISPATYLTIVL